MRFLIDKDVHECLKFILAEWQHDAMHANLIPELESLPDPDLLAYAVARDRIVITYNMEDYQALHEDYEQAGRRHPGILCCRQQPGYRNFGRLLQWMRNFLAVETESSLRSQIRYLHSQYP